MGANSLQFVLDFSNGMVTLGANLLAQTVLLASLGLFVGWMLRNKKAALRSAVLRATLAAIVLSPLASFGLNALGVRGVSFNLPRAALKPIKVPAQPSVHEQMPSMPIAFPRQYESGAELAPLDIVNRVETFPTTIPDRIPKEVLPIQAASLASKPDRLCYVYIALTAIWLAVSTLLLLRLLIAHAWMLRLRRGGRQAPPVLRTTCDALARDMGARPPRVLTVPLVRSPCLTGFLRPALLFPESSNIQDTVVVRDIIVHELAHLARCDCAWNFFGVVTKAILFFQPLIWRLTRRVTDTSDEVADDWVVQHGTDRRGYARLLYNLAECLQRSPAEGLASVGVIAFPCFLERRVRRVLDTTRSLSVRIGVRAAVVIIAVTLCATFATGLVGAVNSHLATAAARFETGLAYRLEGDEYFGSEQFQEALDAYLPAVDVFEGLTLDFPEEAEYQREYASSEKQLGVALRHLGRHEEALEATRNAVARMEALVDSSPADPDLLNTLVQAYRERGSVFKFAAKGKEAEQAYRQALEIADGLVAAFPDVPEYRYELAWTYQNIGGLLLHQGRKGEGTKARRQMVAHLERLVADFPDEASYHRRLARGHAKLALILSDDKGRDPELMKEAVRQCQETVELAPMKSAHRECLADSCKMLADTLVARERHDEAIQAYEQSIAVIEGHLSTIPDGRTDLIRLMGKLRDLLEAVGRVEEAKEVRNRAETYRQELLAGSLAHLLIENRLVGIAFMGQARAGRVRYQVRIGSPGEYRLYVRLDGHDGRSDSLCAWVDELGDGSGGSVADAYVFEPNPDADFGTGSWNGSAYFERHTYREEPTNAVWSIPAAGVYTVGFAMGHDGVAVDAFILQRSDLPPPSGYGPEESRMSPEGAFMESNGTLVVEAEHFTSRSNSQSSWLVVPDEDPGDVAHQNFRGTGYIQALPDTTPTEEQRLANLTLAIESDPNDTKALLERANQYFHLTEQYSLALEDFSAVIALEPDNAEALTQRGRAYMQLEQWDKALADYSQAIELQPEDAKAWHNRGSAYHLLEQWDKAVTDYSKILELQPDSAHAWNDRAVAYSALGQFDKAASDFAAAAGLEPNNSTLRYLEAMAKLAAGDTDGYRETCAGMLEQFSQTDNPDTAYWAAWTCVLAPEAVGDFDQPMALAQKASQGSFPVDSCRRTVASLLYRAGRFDEALASLQEQASEDAGQTSPAYAWFFLAMTHHRLGHTDESHEWLDKAIAQAEQEIANNASWNRKATLQLLRQEAESLILGTQMARAERDQS